MAKKNKKDRIDTNNKKGTVKGKVFATLLILLIVFVWLAIFALLIKLDVGGFGSSILRPLIKDVPIINKVLPDVSDEQLAYENNYPYKSLEDAIERIKELELEMENMSDNDTDSTDKIKELEAEITRLKVFEENQLAFEERQKAFDTEVVFGENAPSIEEYKKYYESINPTHAEEIYRQVVEQGQISKSIQEKADIYKKMKPKAAAQILETMTADIDLVAQMLLSMSPSESSAILAEMDSIAAAKITKKMFDLGQATE